MTRYSVDVTNKDTGEHRTLLVNTPSPKDAQAAALSRAFRELGWRRSTAAIPAEIDLRLEIAAGRMIAIRGRAYDLPDELCICPRCETGRLVWDGHWSWRCSGSTKASGSCTGRSRYAIPLSAIFADETLVIEFEAGEVDLSRLTLTPSAAALLSAGLIRLSERWTPRGTAPEEDEQTYWRFRYFARLMRQTPAETRAESLRRGTNEEDPDA